jgi:hypothetical protein
MAGFEPGSSVLQVDMMTIAWNFHFLLFKKLPPYTLAGLDLTTHSSSLLRRWQAETLAVDHTAAGAGH